MIHQTLNKSNQKEIKALFTSVFTASEGEQEGELIGNLATLLSSQLTSSMNDDNLNNDDIICLGTFKASSLVGCIFFTRLKFTSPLQVFMLAPVAVSQNHQGQGIGQALIGYGLATLKSRSVEIAITYGDPAFYSKVGFQPLKEEIIQAPQVLSMPSGWLGQSLVEKPIPIINERPTCVKAFNDPLYW